VEIDLDQIFLTGVLYLCTYLGSELGPMQIVRHPMDTPTAQGQAEETNVSRY